MFCEKCGAQLQADAKFCTVCGYAVNNGQTPDSVDNNTTQQSAYNPGMNNTAYNNEGLDFSVNNNSFVDDGFGAQMQPAPIPKSKKTPVLAGLFAALAVIAVLAGLYLTLGRKLFATPADKTMQALKNLTKIEAVDVATELKLKLEGSSSENILVKDVIEGMAIRVGGKYDQNKKQGAFDIALNFKKVPVVELKAYMDEDVVIIQSEQLLDEPLYASLEDLEELAGEDLSGMSPTMTIDMDQFAAYEKFIEEIQEDSRYKTVSKNY
ncbi:zinc ribbon domain-containing protein [Clostridium thermarum]|uniref:zinc ribbon domain-containing protein n=1 Tax=Clostridium thermarum TaxID=1716543 RepID=UPI00111E4427|nr:zinc ribbon domain-containing protein [Clostridium thermarum]